MVRGGWLSLAVVTAMGFGWTTTSAQVFVAPAPVVSYYAPPVAVAPAYYFAPAPVVSYYAAPIPVAAPAPVVVPTVAAVPTVSFYAPAYPVRVSRGLFGRTIVRTPFSKTKF